MGTRGRSDRLHTLELVGSARRWNAAAAPRLPAEGPPSWSHREKPGQCEGLGAGAHPVQVQIPLGSGSSLEAVGMLTSGTAVLLCHGGCVRAVTRLPACCEPSYELYQRFVQPCRAHPRQGSPFLPYRLSRRGGWEPMLGPCTMDIVEIPRRGRGHFLMES